MNRFWTHVIEPLLGAAHPQTVVEIGSATGLNTERLARVCDDLGASFHAIDPDPDFDVEALAAKHPCLVFHQEPSLVALPLIVAPDFVLVDGDHNWYTVINELRILEHRSTRDRNSFPLVLIHDMDWPYGRRDMYYHPEAIPAEFRQPYERRGLELGNPGLAEHGGLNPDLANAVKEHDYRNGVRTAVENFLEESSRDLVFLRLRGIHGLGIVVERSRLDANRPLKAALEHIESVPFLRRHAAVLEDLRLRDKIARSNEALHAAESAQRFDSARLEWTRRREELEGRLARADADLTTARARFDELSVTSQQAEARLAELEEVLAQLRQANEALESEREETLVAKAKLERERAWLEERASTQLQEIARRSEEVERVRAEARQVERRAAELEAAVAQLREANEGLQSEKEEMLAARALLDREHAALEERAGAQLEEIARRNDELEQLRASGRRAEARAAGLEAALAQLRDADEALQSEKEDALATSAKLERERAWLEERTSAQLKEISSRGEEITQLRAERDVFMRDHHLAVGRLRARLETERERLVAEVRKAQSELAETEEATRAKLEAYDEEFEDVRARLEQEAATREALSAELDERQVRLTRVTDELAALKELSDDLESRLGEREDQLSMRETELAAARRDIGALRDALDMRELEFTRLAANVVRARQEIDRARQSRSWRFGHWLFRALSILALRRPGKTSGLDRAMERLDPARLPVGTVEEPPDTLKALERSHRRMGGAGTGQPEVAESSDLFATESLPPLDVRGVLTPAVAGGGSVDVVVCVRNALPEVRGCFRALLEKTTAPFHLIVVDDGSDDETAAYLRDFARANRSVELRSNAGDRHGYAVAANVGLRESRGSFVVLLNSDTVVTYGWLERLLACIRSDERLGVVGPLSNAATYQSIPEVRDNGRWATNALPNWMTPDAMALMLSLGSDPQYPRVPWVNGFCYVVRRELLDAIGYLDDENFADGYGEENDFSYRARTAGWQLAVADDCYVYHVKSASYSDDRRQDLAPRGRERLRAKHGEAIFDSVKELEDDPTLAGLRSLTARASANQSGFVEQFRALCQNPLDVSFLLTGMPHGGGGGIHSLVQEAEGMRALGVDATIALPKDFWDRAREAYPDSKDVFIRYRDEDDLSGKVDHAGVLVATQYKSVGLLSALVRDRPHVIPAYYVQDYEPFFADEGSPAAAEAAASYGAVPNHLLFAKTRWLCELVSRAHGVPVAKVEPSIDERTFFPRKPRPGGGPLRVAAMVRLRTPRRQPLLTLAVLERFRQEFPDAVIRTCGATEEELAAAHARLEGVEHRGLLSRDQMAELMSDSDVFLDGSIYQAFGRTALEAMACGATAIVPAVGGCGEFAVHNLNALVPAEPTADALVEALRRLAVDADLRNTLQANALATGSKYSLLRAAVSEYAVFHAAATYSFARRNETRV